jgi:phosphatidylglycerol:prolipoprotein diacylglycerol transferase
MPYSSRVHPVLFHIGAIVIPAYGAAAALGVLLALTLAQRTARIAGVNPAEVWNLCVVALFAALIGSRLLLIAANWRDLSRHPSWMLGLGMVHHPLVGAAGAPAGAVAAFAFVQWQRLPLWNTADALSAPLALGLAFEQIGALLAGSGYGTPSGARWTVTYSSAEAAQWSGTPLGIPVHPVQAYAALAFFTIAVFLLLWLPLRRQAGDAAGLCLMATGFAIFIAELWRDTEGRGSFLGGALDGPQIAAIAMVLAGGVVLRERKATDTVSHAEPDTSRGLLPIPHEDAEWIGNGAIEGSQASHKAGHD